MNLLASFKSFVATEDLFQQQDNLIIAVSGGADSIVLCELCYQSGFHFSMAHCNFQLRGAESERDEAFVKNLAVKYGVKFYVRKFETEQFATANKTGIQETARKLRYAWFEELIHNAGNVIEEAVYGMPAKHNQKKDRINTPTLTGRPRSFLLTAHHANDNIETLLINFFRGTGITGLRGILPKYGHIMRPLLFASKQTLLDFALANNLAFSEDSSNSEDKYTRNYFRNQLIPSIQKVYPKVEENLKENLQRFNDIEMLYQQSVGSHKNKLLEYKGSEVHIPVLKLLKTKPLFTVMYEIIKEYNFTSHQTGEVLHLLNSGSGKYVQSISHKVIRNRNWLIIAPNNLIAAQNILIEENDVLIEFISGKIKIEKLFNATGEPATENTVACLDAAELTFPLLLRKWKPGDYFYPLGMHKKKKLSRFFTDQKMSLTHKENTWVIEMNKKILWIVGKRIDNRFKITPNTKNRIVFTFSTL